jgi:pimeloyl-ACP methyl ester carboxylesterase
MVWNNESCMKSIYFKNSRGQELAGIVEGESSEVGVICCHGMLSVKDGPKHSQIVSGVADKGMMGMRFDFAGRGESDGHIFDLTYSNQIEDLAAAIGWMSAQGVRRIGVFGSSMGGAVALLTAAEQDIVSAVATVAAVAYPKLLTRRYPDEVADWKERGFIEIEGVKIGSQFIEDARRQDVIGAVIKADVPLLVIHGLEDRVVPVSDADDIAAAAESVSMCLVEGADHRFSGARHLKMLVDDVVDFFHANLVDGEEG